MSGFAGMISLDGAPSDRLLLEKMAARLAFRGPDGTHIRTLPGAGFCFTFLRTGPAPQCPSQPCTLDGRTWLLGDIRLDGRDDVRLKLEQHGEELSPEATDEELVLRTWRRWGEDGIAELIGDYAFALWDAEARQLRCWRDLLGARPFFYAQAGGWFYFSNTLDAIRCAPISRDLDNDFIGDFLLQEWCSDPNKTAYKNIRRLPAGHLLSFYNAQLRIEQFISVPIEEPLWLKKEEEYVEQFRWLFKQAVLERLPQAPVAIFMSGGLDSTSVAAVAVDASRESGRRLDLRAYTVDYRPLFGDQEAPLASLAARALGISIEFQSGASYLPYGGWCESPPPMPEPSHEPYQALRVERFRCAGQHARVLMNGYGGDGVMTGQAWPYLIWLLRRWKLLELTAGFGAYILRNGRIPPLRGGFRSALSRWFKRADAIDAYPRWLASKFENELRCRPRLAETTGKAEPKHPWYWIDYVALNGTWACVHDFEDAAWTGAPVESRAPLLDLRLQRFLLRVPPVPLCSRKEILRRSTKGFLPDQVRLRPKTPFLGDLLGFHVANGQWMPIPLPAPQDQMHRFVDWKALEAALRKHVGSLLVNLRPISLTYWLRMAERTL